MILIGQDRLTKACKKDAPLRKWLETWASVVKKAQWTSLIDVRKLYPSADGVQAKNAMATVFNVKGNEYRLITVIDYPIKTVIVGEVLTHPEYSKNFWKARY